MTDPEVILEAIDTGYTYYTNIVHNEIFSAQIGVDKDKCEVDSACLLFILKALSFRTIEEIFDSITEKLYRCLMKILGKYTPPLNVRFYYGLKDTDDTLTLSEITNASFIEAPSGTDPIIPYPVGQGPKYAWMAEMSAEVAKTKWQDTVFLFNNGNIGVNPGDLFRAPYIVNIFRVYITDYPTEFVYPIQFKKV